VHKRFAGRSCHYSSARIKVRASICRRHDRLFEAAARRLKKNLDDQDAKLAAFQQKYFGCSRQEQSNSNTLQSLTTQLDAVTQSVNRQQQDVTFLQTMVAQQTHDCKTRNRAAGLL